MKVWYKLDDNAPSRVAVEDDAIVDDLKKAIKKKWGDRLPCAAPELVVYAAGTAVREGTEPIRADKKLPIFPTSYDAPLMVIAPVQHQLQVSL